MGWRFPCFGTKRSYITGHVLNINGGHVYGVTKAVRLTVFRTTDRMAAQFAQGGWINASPEEKVKQIIVEQLGVDESEVTPTRISFDDLGADSLDIVELVMAF